MVIGTSKATGKSREKRWDEEAGFFDDAARRIDPGTLRTDPLTFRRYSSAVLRKRFSIEFRIRILGAMKDKTILDVGCGDGRNAVLFAKLGAKVTGIDLSAEALQVARLRAEVNGVSDRLTFVCTPVETADLPDNSFDIAWGDGILHHVIDELELVMGRLVLWVKPEGFLLFSEPVNLFPPLRRLRQMIPVHTEATPGERPLLRAEVDMLRQYFLDLRMRHYHLLGRLDQFILVNCNYEKSPAFRRAIVSWTDLIDYALLSLPLFKNLGGSCVMYGHPNQRRNSRG
ncbi:MAG: class I SAM-dependent methyltransferase [Candidatus Rokubacteria bacterium]|nr:class I SAM-dependent methyltransferase [Candidatus Rokubacteria bacterium]